MCVYVPLRYGAVLEIHAQTASSNCDTFLPGPADKNRKLPLSSGCRSVHQHTTIPTPVERSGKLSFSSQTPPQSTERIERTAEALNLAFDVKI